MDSIKQSMADMSKIFHTKMAQFQLELQQMASETASPSKKLSLEFNAFKEFILSALKSLQSQIEALADMYDQMEMRNRRKILLVHGVSEEEKDPVKAVSDMVTKHLKLSNFNITSSVKQCHRLGKLNTTRPRPILVKFCDLESRSMVWSAKTHLKQTGLTVSEFLTKRRHEIFMMARRRFGISKCWTQDGCIIVLGQGGSRCRVMSMTDLDTIPIPIQSDDVAPTEENLKEKKTTAPVTSRAKRAVRKI